MTKSRLPIALIAAALAGCEPAGPRGVLSAPHGGTLIDLPEGKGFVEVLRRDAPGKPGGSRVVLVFLDAVRRPMVAPPASATLKLRTDAGKSIDLKPTDPADPDGPAALASPPLPAGEIEGQVTATVDGKPAVLTINVR